MGVKASNYLDEYSFHFSHLISAILWFTMGVFMKKDIASFLLLLIPWLLFAFLIVLFTLAHIICELFEKNARKILISLTLIPLTFIYCLIGLGIAVYQPDPHMVLHINQKKMMEVVELVKSEELKMEEYGTKLPPRYGYLSNSGEIIIRYSDVNGYEIKFFIYRGLIDEYSSVIYSQVDDFEQSQHYYGDYFEELAPNWYFVKSG